MIHSVSSILFAGQSTRSLYRDSFAPSASSDTACIEIIGGADGPTAIVFGDSSQGKVSTVCSALHFEPVQHDIDWCITFHEKNYIDFTLTLM